ALLLREGAGDLGVERARVRVRQEPGSGARARRLDADERTGPRGARADGAPRVKPEVGRVLEVCAAAMMLDVAPHVAPSYRQSSVFASALLLTCIREELDRIASRRVEENRALRALFADAAPGIEEASLRERLARAGAEDDGDLRISALEARNAAL